MAKKPEDRYQTPAQLAAVLVALRADPAHLSTNRPNSLLPTVPTVRLPPVAELVPEPALIGEAGGRGRAVAKVGNSRRVGLSQPVAPVARSTPPEGVTPICPSRVVASTGQAAARAPLAQLVPDTIRPQRRFLKHCAVARIILAGVAACALQGPGWSSASVAGRSLPAQRRVESPG